MARLQSSNHQDSMPALDINERETLDQNVSLNLLLLG